ncbi:hypothetical protein ACFCX0_46895 [Streptomyces sp. NPDC056352]|uniref:hypothetical protein n=1 Tax=Streptomyces sp. NPDC056352 TaxID=3345791 RepID=UPI0035E2725C
MRSTFAYASVFHGCELLRVRLQLVTAPTVGRLLEGIGFSLRGAARALVGARRPYRGAQVGRERLQALSIT